jgi:putative Holliday junction resolvase
VAAESGESHSYCAPSAQVRILGIDPGERRIGIAVSDPEGRLAVPVAVYARHGKGAAADIAATARRELAELIVVGLALNMDGSRGLQAERAERFGRALHTASRIPVVFWDERLSTREAARLMLESGASRRRRKADLDAASATVILQDYLDCHAAGETPLLVDS